MSYDRQARDEKCAMRGRSMHLPRRGSPAPNPTSQVWSPTAVPRKGLLCQYTVGSIYICIKKGRRNAGQLADGTHSSGGFLGHLDGGSCRVCPGRLGALHVCERHHHHSRHERIGRPCCTQLGFVAFAPGLHLWAGTMGMLHLVECCLCAWDMLHLVE